MLYSPGIGPAVSTSTDMNISRTLLMGSGRAGHQGLLMGVSGCRWTDTTSSKMAGVLDPQLSGDHDPLHDALYQAELFRLMRKQP